MDSIEIVNLIEEPQYIKEVSEWIWKEWEVSHGAKLEDSIYRTKHSINKDDIPQMYIAKLKNEVVGVVSLWRNDLKSRQDLSIEQARKLNYEYLYLITEHNNYYEKTGWEYLETAPLDNGKYTKIYRYNLKK